MRSIPPSHRTSRPPPHYTRMRTNTLEALLAEAERLESEQLEIVKLLPPDDEELSRLDKLQTVIIQLKKQIALRRLK